jgi:acetyltransferase-like isoleucine patch superfamily enzyme
VREEYKASLQKKIMDEQKSSRHKYSSIVIGKKGLFVLLKCEFIIFFFSWIPGALGFFFRKIFYPLLFHKVGKGVVFGRNVTLRQPHKISIGDHTVIDDNVVLDAKGEENEGIRIGKNVYIGRNTIISCKEGSIYLGDYCNLSANCSLLSETEIRIGKYCFLAGRCYLVAGGNHTYDDISTPIMFQPSISKGGIMIKDDIWLGAGAIILDGVSLEKGCIVGAASVVTKSFKEYSVILGYPAWKIKDRRKQKKAVEV